MKKITLSLFSALLSVGYGYSQVTATVTAPPFNGASTQLRAPNGNSTQAGMRGCFLVTQAELAPFLLTNSVVTAFGFTLANGTSAQAVTGAFTLYVQNTADATYLKGTNWPTAISGMTTVLNGGPLILPVNANPTSIPIPITSFSYTGGGLYVAYDWASPGPFDASAVTYYANNAMTVGGATADTPTLPTPTTMTTTPFRPCFLFSAANTASNDIQVTNVVAPGKVAFLLNTAHTVSATVKNASNITKTNIAVGLGISGANTLNGGTVITSLAAGASSLCTFPFNPQIQGINTISVGVNSDQVNTNNTLSWTQSVTCVVAAANPPLAAYSTGIGFPSSTGNIGYKLVPPVTSNLSGVNLAISPDAASVGTPVYGVLLNSSGAIVATTNTLNITAGMASTFQSFVFSTPQPVTAGSTYYVGMGLPNSATYPIGAVTTGYQIPGGLYYTTPLTGGTLAQQGNAWYLGIEPVYAPTGALLVATQSSTSTCSGQSVTLTATGMGNYGWTGTPTPTTGASIVVSPNVTTSYTVTGLTTTISGCPVLTGVQYLTQNVVTLPNITVTAPTGKNPICKGKSTTLTAAGGAPVYNWSTVTTNTNAITITPSVTTTYSVYGSETTLGCKSNTAAITVTVSACVGISVNAIDSGDIHIFPNPAANGKSEISGLSGVNTITIYNLLGQTVLTEKTEKDTFVLDFSNQPNGTYLVKISDNNNDSRIVKIINQN